MAERGPEQEAAPAVFVGPWLLRPELEWVPDLPWSDERRTLLLSSGVGQWRR